MRRRMKVLYAAPSALASIRILSSSRPVDLVSSHSQGRLMYGYYCAVISARTISDLELWDTMG